MNQPSHQKLCFFRKKIKQKEKKGTMDKSSLFLLRHGHRIIRFFFFCVHPSSPSPACLLLLPAFACLLHYACSLACLPASIQKDCVLLVHSITYIKGVGLCVNKVSIPIHCHTGSDPSYNLDSPRRDSALSVVPPRIPPLSPRLPAWTAAAAAASASLWCPWRIIILPVRVWVFLGWLLVGRGNFVWASSGRRPLESSAIECRWRHRGILYRPDASFLLP